MSRIVLPILNIIFHIFLIFMPITTLASTSVPRNTVNILSWWGYLDHPRLIAEAEKQCGVTISHDVYFSNEEFLRRWRGSEENYDILIFSESIYKTVMPSLPRLRSTLWKESDDYHPVIRAHYLSSHYPNNVVYFAHALTGFLWNKQVIQLSATDAAASIFEKAGNHAVVMIDDPAEVRKFLEDGYNHGQVLNVDQTADYFNHMEKITKGTRIYFSNDFLEMNNSKNIAFIYAWSGEAMYLLHQRNNSEFSFLLHPKLSHITSDLLAQTTNNPGAYCVAKYLTSKETMSVMQNLHFYFTPYANYSFVSDPNFRLAYENFVKNLPLFPWLVSTDIDAFNQLNTAWALTKIRLSKSRTP